MKPFQILLFILSVFLVLFAVTLYFPEDGITLSDDLKLRFYTANDLFGSDSVEYANIQNIISQNKVINDSVITAIANISEDTSELNVFDTVRANTDSLKKSIVRIEYPDGNKLLLYPFFKELKHAKDSGRIVHILHYGDSQIECDRMTSLIRNKLQAKFGGYGAGLVPASQLYDFSFAIIQSNSSNWYRYTLFGNRDTTIKHRRYGALGSFCMFEPYGNDTLPNDTSTYKAWISFNQSSFSYQNTKTFYQCRIFYGYNREPFLNEVFCNNELYDADIFPPVNGMKEIIWKFNEPKSNVMLKFSGRSSPEIYGITLEPASGIAVDNIPMRGCSGNIFTSIEFNQLKLMLDKLNTKLILLQFGGNVVPHVVKDYGYYEESIYRQIIYLKKACPDAVILVIGPADMSVKDKNRYITYPNLEKVRDALRSATMRGGAAFWDMYKAMGGKNSMPSWVFAEPPLASKDFVHFNPSGAVLISQMFYNALIYEYNLFEKNQIY